MIEKAYGWSEGAVLDEHSRRKHKILREYLADYMAVRCSMPMQSRFRLAIIDGFAGAGRYQCGSPGSPIIFLEALKRAAEEINIYRAGQGLGKVSIDLLIMFNDEDPSVIELLKQNVAPVVAAIKDETPQLNVDVHYFSEVFEAAYPNIKRLLKADGFESSVLFNLDQCGHSDISTVTLVDILRSYPSAEIFHTFAIQALLTFLRKNDRASLDERMRPFGVTDADLDNLEDISAKKIWLGAAERIVFDAFRRCGAFTSPFSINNPHGWRYWMIHFANNYRARQVYNDVLHRNSSAQAHFGRSGLKMLSYDPRDEGMLYLFGDQDREVAEQELYDDIPRVVANYGDAIGVRQFYHGIYNETPAHSDDIHAAMMRNPDVSVLTPSGNERRKPNTIKTGDVLKLRDQRSFHEILFPKKGFRDQFL